jgi:HEPN domain-containing protein
LNRAELQQLSDDRIEDARILLAASRWSAAYYLSGYSLECALKSCILAHVERTGAIFLDKKYAEKCWTHNIVELVKQAGIALERDRATGTNPALYQNWIEVIDWSEASRYEVTNQTDAEALYKALTNNPDGVLPWIKTYW